jgi:hypothetical protein
MTDDLLQRAVRNNAEWCDAVCRAHGRPGEFREVMWINRHGTPRFYPNLVTLAATAEPDAYMEGLRELVAAGVPGDWGVKDSFAALDLAPLGFRLLFDAQWIARAASDPRVEDAMSDVRWLKVERVRELADWELAWAGVPVDLKSSSLARVFLPPLLADDNVAFIAAYQDHRLVAGAIANRAANVVGWSNLFVPTVQADRFRGECLAQVVRAFPGLPVVGYETGEALAQACTLGFGTVGPLRVWVRQNETE